MPRFITLPTRKIKPLSLCKHIFTDVLSNMILRLSFIFR